MGRGHFFCRREPGRPPEQKWDEASIGVVMSVAGAGLIGFTAMMPETLRHARDEGGGRGD